MPRYELNANEFTGSIDIEVNQSQDTCTGSMHFTATPNGDPINQRADIENGTLEGPGFIVEFDRGPDADAQHYYGWYSSDNRVIGGYFTKPSKTYQLPWFATRQ